MASMQCDICGEGLTMDVSGEFAICDYCGVKHPKARLMKKVSGISAVGRENEQQQESVSYKEVNRTETVPVEANVSVSDIQAESFNAPEPESNTYSEPEVQTYSEPESSTYSEPVEQTYQDPILASQVPIMGAMDIGMGMDVGVDNMTTTDESTVNQPETEGMTAAEIAENEKKNSRIEELKVELKEFEDIYEANKNKFLGEGLKRKNYSEIKIKEIREKLEELGA